MALPERVGIGLLFAVIAVLAYVSMIPQLKPWVGASVLVVCLAELVRTVRRWRGAKPLDASDWSRAFAAIRLAGLFVFAFSMLWPDRGLIGLALALMCLPDIVTVLKQRQATRSVTR